MHGRLEGASPSETPSSSSNSTRCLACLVASTPRLPAISPRRPPQLSSMPRPAVDSLLLSALYGAVCPQLKLALSMRIRLV